MLPILFTLTIEPAWGIPVWLLASLISGAWQWRAMRKAGETPQNALKAFGTWTVGTAAVLFVAVKMIGGQNILALERPLAVPVHTYGILVAGGFLVAMTMAGRAAERMGLDRERVPDL